MHKSYILGILFAFILIITPIIVVMTSTDSTNEATEMKISAAQEHTPKLTKEDIIKLTKKFKQQLIQETDESGKVLEFESKAEYMDSFSNIAKQESLPQFVDVLYQEKEDGLYLNAMDTPPWFNEYKDYDMIETDNHTFVVTQENTSDLHGEYTIQFEFVYDQHWKIKDVQYESGE